MKKVLSIILAFVIIISLSACQVKKQTRRNYSEDAKPYQQVFYAFDTNCYINLYGLNSDEEGKSICDNMIEIINGYERQLSKTIEGSDLYEINHRTTDSVMVTDWTAGLFEIAQGFYDWSSGRFDISAGTLIDLWDINNKMKENNHIIPDKSEINEAKKHCGNFNYTIEMGVEPDMLKGNRITFHGDKKTQYDLGGLVKGYVCDSLKMSIAESDAKACLINLGGNVCCIGKIPGREKGAADVGIYKPFDEKELIDTIKIVDKCVITSGNYQRYFKVDGDDRIYHHIIDPKTGYPTDNELNAVTIISASGLCGDYLSTACMLLGIENSKPLVNFCTKLFKDDNIQAIYVDKNNNVTKYPEKVKTY